MHQAQQTREHCCETVTFGLLSSINHATPPGPQPVQQSYSNGVWDSSAAGIASSCRSLTTSCLTHGNGPTAVVLTGVPFLAVDIHTLLIIEILAQ